VSINGDREASIRTTMAELTHPHVRDTHLDDTLASVTHAAVRLMAGVDYADVLLIDKDGFQSAAATSPLVTELDAVQVGLQQGPCFEAAVRAEVVTCPDLRSDERWPEFAAAAVDAGVRSMMSYQLYTHQHGTGALNLLGSVPTTFGFQEQVIGAMLATHAAIALLAANKQEQFESALASRDLIGQAKGMIMERFQVNAVKAFELLTKLSQDANTPVRHIAQRIVDGAGAT
jgi:GAF domain-containing protein